MEQWAPGSRQSFSPTYWTRTRKGTTSFVFLFHQRLLEELRRHPDNKERDPIKLAAKTDRKCALHSHDQHGMVNAVVEEPLNPAITAI
jgi:hypothetical protein